MVAAPQSFKCRKLYLQHVKYLFHIEHELSEEVAKHLWLHKYFDKPVRKESPLVLADMFYPGTGEAEISEEYCQLHPLAINTYLLFNSALQTVRCQCSCPVSMRHMFSSVSCLQHTRGTPSFQILDLYWQHPTSQFSAVKSSPSCQIFAHSTQLSQWHLPQPLHFSLSVWFQYSSCLWQFQTSILTPQTVVSIAGAFLSSPPTSPHPLQINARMTQIVMLTVLV